MKKNKDPFMRFRIILSSIFLTIILGGWLIYGLYFVKTNPTKILTNLSTKEKEDLGNLIDKIDLSKESHYTISLNEKKKLYLYINIPDNKLYLYNDKNYYNFLNNKTMSIKNKDYKQLLNSYIDCFTHNYKLLNVTKKKDDEKGYYIYSYALDSLYPLTSTLKTDKAFVDTLKKSFKLDNKDILDMLNKYNDSSIGLNVITKGRKRDIEYYNLKIDNLFSIYKDKDHINGYILDYGFMYDKELVIYTENNDYHTKIEENDQKININKLKESTLEDILSIIK